MLAALHNRKVILIGDTNIDLLEANDDNTVLNYKSLLASFGFAQCITGPTREEFIMGSLTSSCIDHIFCAAQQGRSIHEVSNLSYQNLGPLHGRPLNPAYK